MKNPEIEIRYEETYDRWAKEISNILEKRHIVYDTKTINRIQQSILKKTNDYLFSVGYKPKDNLSYRKNLVDRLKREGLKLSIISNRILWLYLEYFLDLDDYTDCFDISIVVDNIEVATKNTIFISVKQDKINLAKEALIETDKHAINKENLELVKKLNEEEKDLKIDLILKVLENFIQEED